MKIFLGVFTLLFVEGGGYKSGMPLYFIMAVVFTAFMLEGREMYAFIALELCWYSALCTYAYRHPESIRVLENEGSLVMDILIALPVVSIILATTMFLQLRLIRRNQTEWSRPGRKPFLPARRRPLSWPT